MLKTALISCLAVCLAACSRVEITKVTDATYKDGLRFYRSEPYLLVTEVTADAEQKKQTSVIYLPNKTQEYVVRSSFGLGATEVAATLEGGWNLAQLGTKVDTKVPEIITAFTGSLSGAGKGATLLTTLPLDTGLYRINFDPNTGVVSGLEKIMLPEQSQRAKQ